jgi:SAM-dependent methyltransferase
MPSHELHNTHYAQVSHAFDQAAQSYDPLYQANPVMAWLRRESLEVLQATFPPASRLLEIGCGTGDEALALGRAGHKVVATDISAEMIETAQAKAVPGTGDVTWRVLPAGQLADLVGDYGSGSFDGAYASFGGLNCEPDLAQTVSALVDLLRPGAQFVCSVMNRWCVWEIGWGLVHFHPGQAFRRLKQGWLDAGLASPQGRLTVPTRYYSARGFARYFEPSFRVHQVRGLPVLLPPPYLGHLLERYPVAFSRLKGIECRLRDRYPFCSMGDHTLLVMVREGH